MKKVINSRSIVIALLCISNIYSAGSVKLKDIMSVNDNNMTAQYMFAFDGKVEVELEQNKKNHENLEHVRLTVPVAISSSLQNSINYIHSSFKPSDGFSVKIIEKKQDKSFICEISFDPDLIDFKMSNGNSVSNPYALILNFYKKNHIKQLHAKTCNNRLLLHAYNDRSSLKIEAIPSYTISSYNNQWASIDDKIVL